MHLNITKGMIDYITCLFTLGNAISALKDAKRNTVDK